VPHKKSRRGVANTSETKYPASVFHSAMHRRFAPALVAAIALFAAACRDAPLGFGPTPAAAARNADEFLAATSQRFTSIVRTPKTAYIRRNLGSGALIPSRVMADTGLWTGSAGDTLRVVIYSGFYANGRYTFTVRNPAERLDQLADAAHSTRLRRLSSDEYEWVTATDFVLGHAPPNSLPAAVARSLQSAERLGTAGVKTDYRTSFPRTTKALGRLYSIDSLSVVRDAEGASLITMTLRADPDRLRHTHSALADYLKKYIDRTNAHVLITDRRGIGWFELRLSDKRMHLRLRARDGRFAPLAGPVRPLPDSLIVRSTFTTRIMLFEVGWRNAVTDMTLTRSDTDQAWQFRSTREPEWELPPLTRRFIRTPLRRPFAGQGINFRIGFRTLPNGQTSLYRRGVMQVQESAILRFLGRLSGRAMDDFYGRSEMDEVSFNADAFRALRADIADILGPAR
jgi:hypothetical protein